MTSPDEIHPVAPIELGHGKTEFEVFLEPTCPFSKRAFQKFQPLLDAAGADRLTIRIRFLSQPWHLYSGVVTRAILAASATEGGKEAALSAMAGIYRHREEFEFDDHCSGANMHRTPADILRQVAELAGVDLTAAFCWKSVDRALRWHVKYCRQNGVHVSPSFAVNRILEPSMSSGQTVEEWLEVLHLSRPAAAPEPRAHQPAQSRRPLL
jgi:hypothetical protein